MCMPIGLAELAGVTHIHVAGEIHVDPAARAPHWLALPADVNALLPELWSANTSKNTEGVLQVAGLDVDRIAARGRHPGVRPGRRRPQGPGPGVPGRIRGLAGLLRRQVLPLYGGGPLGGRRGLGRRRLHRGRARRGAAGRGRSGADRAARQQQERGGAADRPGGRGRPDHRRLVRRDRPAGAARGLSGGPAAGDGPGDHRRRGAHPRVHRDRARGPEVRLLDRRRPGGGRRCRPATTPACSS